MGLFFEGEPKRNVISKIKSENSTVMQQGRFSFVQGK